jgi:hypothetical protein
MIHKFTIATYKVPATVEGENVTEDTMDLQPEMITHTEDIEIDTEYENLTLKITQHTKNIAQYNERQLVYARKRNQTNTFILKKILKKNKS